MNDHKEIFDVRGCPSCNGVHICVNMGVIESEFSVNDSETIKYRSWAGRCPTTGDRIKFAFSKYEETLYNTGAK